MDDEELPPFYNDINKYRKHEMCCKNCNYQYQYEGEPYEWETCPICGHGAPFSEFENK